MENKLFNDNIRLVNFAIQQLHCPKEIYDDCYQEGCIGLFLAAQRYDESVGKFSTYAVAIIKGHIIRYLRDENELLKIPRRVRVNRNNILRLRRDGLSDTEIMQKLGITEADFADAESILEIASLDFSVTEDLEYQDFVADTSEYVEDEIALQEHVIGLAENICKDFKSLNADICMESLYSKLYEETPITQMELANKYKVSQPKVSRILFKFYNLLKKEYYK